ncbi:MAG TPA: hypothetical protein PKC91_01905 [Ignavibacteria bacterium]|mgnify:CR=1 FL=1|nr:hypothetical protein [Ignavibacteria bacterium]
MKTFNNIFLISVILIFSVSSIFSQTDQSQTYYTDNISIDYSDDSLVTAKLETGKMKLIPISGNLNNINAVRMFNDSILSVSGDNISRAMLYINKINSISIKNGTHVGLGIGLGALAGLGVGILIVSTANYEQTSDPLTNLILIPVNTGVNLLLGVLSTLSGAFLGGIIGGNITSYDKYYLNEVKYDKKNELEKILKIDAGQNGLQSFNR